MHIIDESDYLEHYGTPRHSGRYPWGTSGWGAGDDGGSGTQRNMSFLDFAAEMREQGMSDGEIATAMGMSSSEFRRRRTIERANRKQAQINMAVRLKEKQYSNEAIAERMGLAGESSVRNLLKDSTQDKLDVYNATRDMLRKELDEKGWIDVGAGVENQLGISPEKKKAAIQALLDEGYTQHYGKVDQLGTGEPTSLIFLGPKGATGKDAYANRDNIKEVVSYSEDGGRTYEPQVAPKPISSSRVQVRYGDQGGAENDGAIYVRPGVEDLSLGKNNYAQVRIAVDGTHYLKGMAVYKNDLPKGVDIQFNTPKADTGNKLDAMKDIKDDPFLPFGSIVRPATSIEVDGKKTATSVMNIVNDEEDWENWSKSLASQVLSKQRPTVAKSQLNEAYQAKRDELDEIKSLTNPTVRRKLLESFADDADASSVKMKAAAMPRQRTQVLLPVNSLKDNEIYAPNFRAGEEVVLIRYPHGGKFEIPSLRVNNKNAEGKELLGQAPNAVGINAKVAKRLSGADFDGDTVLVIPNSRKRIETSPALESLKEFDPIREYPLPEGAPKMNPNYKQTQMGVVSNLITDMTIRGASDEDLARAVRHSMVVIDAEKHPIDYKASYQHNGIKQLQKKYQADPDRPGEYGGAATIISRSTSGVRVPDRTPRRASDGGPIDSQTGERRWTPTGESYVDSTGKTVLKTISSTAGAETNDAHTLIDGRGTTIERVYADHSNRMKGLANDARLTAEKTPPLKSNPSAKKTYSKEAASLNAKLNRALQNAPRERQAQIAGNAELRARRQANPTMTKGELKKLRALILEKNRARFNAKKERIDITPSEWDAIQAGAVSNHRLTQILNNADEETIKKYATPKRQLLMTPSKTSRAKAMMGNGYTQAEVADALGVSLTTLKRSIND